ncbi:MAG: hypothetical protein WCA35_29670, partial [Kovacikia sp.]
MKRLTPSLRRLRLRDLIIRLARIAGIIGQSVRPALAPALWLGLLTLLGWAIFSAFLWLASIPPLPTCKKLPNFAPDSDKLYCAERAARSGKVDSLLAGFALVKSWDPNHPLHNRVNRAVKEWSKSVLTIAQQEAAKGDFEAAISLARKIPANSPMQKEVRAAIAGWQNSQNQVPVLEKAFEAALQRQDWQTAEDKTRTLFRLKRDEEGQQQVNHLRQRLAAERGARDQIRTARLLIDGTPKTVETLSRAIAQAEQIRPDTYVSVEAKADLVNWGQLLLGLALKRMADSDWEGAIA